MILFALEAMLSATLLMLLVLAVRRPVTEMFGAEWAYALWLLPVIVPLLPAPEAAPAFTLLLPPVGAEAAPAEGAGASAEWLLLLLALWGGGAAFFAIWQQSTYSAFMLHLGPQGRTAVPPSYGGIKVVVSDAVDGPIALGVFNRRIVVPLDFAARYSAAEQRLALEHELVHHRRLDLVWNWLALAMLTLNWFNPIAHFAFRAFRTDQELACDAAVTRRSPGERHDYACALVKSASEPGLIAVCPLNRAEFLKRRLRMMKQHRASWARTFGGAASIGLVGAAGLVFATPGFAEPEPRQIVMAERGAEPVISRSDVATLRAKCGGDEKAGRSITCSGEEARDPQVRSIMDRTMVRARQRAEEAASRAVEARSIHNRVAERTAELRRIDRNGRAQRARATAQRREQLPEINRAELRASLEESLGRVREQLARLDHDQRRQMKKVMHKHLAALNRDAIRGEALRASRIALLRLHPHGLPEDAQDSAAEAEEARREAAEERREALREAAEARREAAEARQEAQREAQQERREFAREMRELQRELDRELRSRRRAPPIPFVPMTPATPPTPPTPATPRPL